LPKTFEQIAGSGCSTRHEPSCPCLQLGVSIHQPACLFRTARRRGSAFMIHRRRPATALPLLAILFLFNNDSARISAQTLYRVSIQQSVSVKMRDGVSLVGDIYRPVSDGKF